MGTHPSGPAVISGQATTLKEWIQAHPEALGDAVLKRFGADLPYLFKVLASSSLNKHFFYEYRCDDSAVCDQLFQAAGLTGCACMQD
jgi:hypothetical protein